MHSLFATRDIIKDMIKRFCGFCVAMVVMLSGFLGAFTNVNAVTEEHLNNISKNCETIKTNLKELQHADSRARVYLNLHYGLVINNLVSPLNTRLIENAISNKKLIENQNSMLSTQTNFKIDFIEYQQVLEELVGMDCKKDSRSFYNKLKVVREKREILNEDAAKLRRLMDAQVTIVTTIKENL